MENASKALIIAGGILLAIITLSLIVYMITATQRMGEAQDAKTLAEQLVAFNMEYEAYNKRRMYGTEVMTVVNKAINYNESLDISNIERAITITIITTQDFYTTEVAKIDYTNGNYKEKITEVGDKSLNAGSHRIEYRTDGNIIDFFSQKVKDYIKETKTTPQYVEVTWHYSALTNFKRAIFECKDVQYNENTGRIDEMVFEQIK